MCASSTAFLKNSADEVLLRVHAAGVNPLDWKIRQGLLKEFQPLTFPYTPGIEVAGVVEALGYVLDKECDDPDLLRQSGEAKCDDPDLLRQSGEAKCDGPELLRTQAHQRALYRSVAYRFIVWVRREQ